MKPRAARRSVEEREYSRLRKEWLEKYPLCQCSLSDSPCGKKATEIHHKKGRAGKLLNDTRYWMSVCRSCHDFIERHGQWAKEMGYKINRCKPDEQPQRDSEPAPYTGTPAL